MSPDTTHASGHGKTGRVLQDLTGQELAGCKITRKLGQGAMGTVYLAEQLNLQRPVAIKVLDPKFSRDLVYIERFEREAQNCARLVHFNVVQVYDYGRSGETYYIVSEFVDGQTVQAILDTEGAMAGEDATEILLQAARGLAAAQEAGIVHRDIKPENLMINRQGVVKIADFGLAKAVEDDAAVTQSGMIVGTPFYMSPEQAKGLTLDGRSDLYSLGVTYFHMVTGELPFEGDSVIGVLLKHISAERPDPAEVNPAVPSIVGEVILKLMAREPEARYASAEALVPDLEDVLERLRSGETGAAVEDVAVVDPERQKRYKRLRSSLVAQLVQRTVPPGVLERMQAQCKADTGVFVETDKVFPEGALVEMRFSVPGRPGLLKGIGLVRWTVLSGARPGMGITFLKVSPVETERPIPSESAEVRRAKMSASQVMESLTQSPLHGRMLKYYYANLGRAVTVQNIAGALGVGARMLDERLSTYKRLGLAVDKGEGAITFIWPDDRDLQNAIVDWIQKFGLR